MEDQTNAAVPDRDAAPKPTPPTKRATANPKLSGAAVTAPANGTRPRREPTPTAPTLVAEPTTPSAPREPSTLLEPARRQELLVSIMADPRGAAEHIALAAVRSLGPQAVAWAAWARTRYPNATADGLARLATATFTRMARREAATVGAFGSVTALAVEGVLLRAQARLALHLAAAYGLDAADEDRVDELVRLLRLPRPGQPASASVADGGRLVAGIALRGMTRRAMPLGGAVGSAVVAGQRMADVARRAVDAFRLGRG